MSHRRDALCRRSLILGLGVLPVAFPSMAPLRAADMPLRFVINDGDNWPWHLSGDRRPTDKPGLLIELVQEAGRHLGREIQIVRVPFRRGMHMLREGLVTGIAGISYQPERAIDGHYPMTPEGQPDPKRSLAVLTYSIYVRPDAPRIKWVNGRIENLTGRIGVVQGYAAATDLRCDGYPLEEGPDNKTVLAWLASGRVSAAVVLDGMADAVLRHAPDIAGRVVRLTPPYRQKPYYPVLSRRLVMENPSLAKQIWSVMSHLSNSDWARARMAEYSALPAPATD